MHFEILVEEPSAEAALEHILPKILGEQHSFNIHVFNGKGDFLLNLPNRLQGYRFWLPDDWRIVALIDEDRQDCKKLKSSLEQEALNAGFSTKSSSRRAGTFQVLNRLAIEELEAWFFGDIEALVSAYPRVPQTLAAKAKYRDPDAISGGTWEALERILKRYGYYPAGLPKIEAAIRISKHMVPERNRSRSLQLFHRGLLEAVR